MASLCWVVLLLAGVSLSSAEVKGTPTTVEEYPTIVQIESNVGVLWLQQCAGSVLTSLHILSAASCFLSDTDATRFRRIRAGSTHRGVDGVVTEISRVVTHPDFGTLGLEGDLAIVRLESALPLGETIQQASILGQGIMLPAGLPVTLVGWGTTAEGDDFDDDQLHRLQLFTIDLDYCTKTYLDEENAHVITENMICAGLLDTDGRDLDFRDLGAPLIYSDTTVGVVSFGVPQGEDHFPLGITAIGSYTDWIVETAAST